MRGYPRALKSLARRDPYGLRALIRPRRSTRKTGIVESSRVLSPTRDVDGRRVNIRDFGR